jgi:hypothetical protein
MVRAASAETLAQLRAHSQGTPYHSGRVYFLEQALEDASRHGLRVWGRDHVRVNGEISKEYEIASFPTLYAHMSARHADVRDTYELFGGTLCPCHIYADIDGSYAANPGFSERDVRVAFDALRRTTLASLLEDAADSDTATAECLGALVPSGRWRDAITSLRSPRPVPEAFRLVITQSRTVGAAAESKLSFHVVAHLFAEAEGGPGRLMFRNNYQVGALMRRFMTSAEGSRFVLNGVAPAAPAVDADAAAAASAGELSGDTTPPREPLPQVPLFDPGVWGKNRCFRAPYQTKRGQRRYLVNVDGPENPTTLPTLEDWLDGLASYAGAAAEAEGGVLFLADVTESNGMPAQSLGATNALKRTSVNRAVARATAEAVCVRRLGADSAGQRALRAAEGATASPLEALGARFIDIAIECVRRLDGDDAVGGAVRGLCERLSDVSRRSALRVGAEEHYRVRINTSWRFCHRKGAEHGSNTVYYYLRTDRCELEQRCFSAKHTTTSAGPNVTAPLGYVRSIDGVTRAEIVAAIRAHNETQRVSFAPLLAFTLSPNEAV